jgi:hypothetical protein
MTVGQLIQALRKFPKDMDVGYLDVSYSDKSFALQPLNDVKMLFVYAAIREEPKSEPE